MLCARRWDNQAKPPGPMDGSPLRQWQEDNSPFSHGHSVLSSRTAGVGRGTRRCWGRGSVTAGDGQQPPEDSEVILRLTHSDWQRRVCKEEVSSPESETRGYTGGPGSGALSPGFRGLRNWCPSQDPLRAQAYDGMRWGMGRFASHLPLGTAPCEQEQESDHQAPYLENDHLSN